MKKVLITGAGGYIGTVLTRHLLDKGYAVIAFDRFFFGQGTLSQVSGNPMLTIAKKDIRDIEPSDLEGVHAVYDFAALSNDPSGDLDPELTVGINHVGRVRVARAAKRAGVARYILSSSCSIYGHSDGEPRVAEAGRGGKLESRSDPEADYWNQASSIWSGKTALVSRIRSSFKK